MAARQERIDAFSHEGTPPADQPLELLCEDHVGTYVIPFLCTMALGKASILTNASRPRCLVGGCPAEISAEP